jgi:hypothetical protein
MGKKVEMLPVNTRVRAVNMRQNRNCEAIEAQISDRNGEQRLVKLNKD